MPKWWYRHPSLAVTAGGSSLNRLSIVDASSSSRRRRLAANGGWAASLRHDHQAVGCSSRNARVVRAEPGGSSEAVARKEHLEFFSFPAAHYELMFADPVRALVNQLVPFRDHQPAGLSIRHGDTRERQLASVGRDAFSKERLTGLPFQRRTPLSNVEDEYAVRLQRLGEGREDRVTTRVVEDVVENPAA